MRVPLLVIRLQSTDVHDARDIVVILRGIDNTVLSHCFADNLANGKPGGQRGIRILENQLHPWAEFSQFLLAQGKYILSVEDHVPVRLVLKTQDGAPAGGLAASRFADKPHGLASLNAEGYAVNSLDVSDRPLKEAGFDREPFAQVPDLQNIVIT